MKSSVTISVPATSANLGPGFDCLGLALSLRNTFEFTVRPAGYEIEVVGEGAHLIPRNASNLVIRAARTLCKYTGRDLPGLSLKQNSLVPVASGMGSSSTALIAGLLGANEILETGLSREEILALAIDMEGHPDNVAPALYGGLVLSPIADEGQPLIVEHIEIPSQSVVIVLPDFQLLTSEARAVLPTMISRTDAIYNIGRLPLVIRALETKNYELLAAAMTDRLHQPYRMPLVPGMADAYEAALNAGAAAVTISGAGPSLIVFARDSQQKIIEAMQQAYEAAGLKSRGWVLEIDGEGSKIF
ncbi:MAG: homoserine kinase [Ardenticatenaceae bacterium]|nr:homoserine kinase [Ardenticatenaceae bacterium]